MSSTQTTVNHTPGPWKVVGGVYVKGPNEEPILSMKKADEEVEANAKLIAAAPELLEALKEEKKFLECLINIVAAEHTVNSIRERLQTIEAAIQKATH